MKSFISILMFLTSFYMYASFPISTNVDTIVVDGKMYRYVGIDSLYKYPIENESLSEYRLRISKQGLVVSDLNENQKLKNKKPITFWQIIGIIVIIWLILSIYVASVAINEMS